MFEGLKDSLGRFRSDVEAAAEVEAEDGDAPTGTDDPDTDTGHEEDGEGAASPGVIRTATSLAKGRIIIQADDLEAPLERLEMALLRNDVEMSVAEAIIDRVREDLLGESRRLGDATEDVITVALRDALVEVMRVDEPSFEDRIEAAENPAVVIFTGVNGVGKTTTIAKLSRHLEERGYSTVLANGDTYRAGANEQLEEHAERLGKRLISHEQGGDPAAVIYDAVEYADANDVDVVLGDTAGRLHTDEDLMNQLAKIDRVIDPDLTVFVDEAVAGQDAVRRAREFDEASAIDGSILTKADADTSGGAAISIAHVTGRPIMFLGTGQGYDDLEAFDPDTLADRLLAD